MRRALLISLSLVLALVGGGLVCAQDFYVIPAMKGKYAPVPKTGETDSHGTPGSDGDLQKGVAWPTPRFTDNKNGTVTDNLTGLIWMQNANFFAPKTWTEAIGTAATVANGIGGVADGSKAGDWRLPNIRELLSLVDFGTGGPAFPSPNPFTGVTWENRYWSSTSENGSLPNLAWWLGFDLGFTGTDDKDSHYYLVWCVRGGK
jgi:hypothetical protein